MKACACDYPWVFYIIHPGTSLARCSTFRFVYQSVKAPLALVDASNILTTLLPTVVTLQLASLEPNLCRVDHLLGRLK